jgi:drug/metabolite transporter (DMT)-like permease
VVLGIALLIVWTLARMTLLSWADLSFVLPVTSAGYVLTALAGKFFLHEQIGYERWAGTVLIMLGVILVGGTDPRTAPAAEKRP